MERERGTTATGDKTKPTASPRGPFHKQNQASTQRSPVSRAVTAVIYPPTFSRSATVSGQKLRPTTGSQKQQNLDTCRAAAREGSDKHNSRLSSDTRIPLPPPLALTNRTELLDEVPARELQAQAFLEGILGGGAHLDRQMKQRLQPRHGYLHKANKRQGQWGCRARGGLVVVGRGGGTVENAGCALKT